MLDAHDLIVLVANVTVQCGQEKGVDESMQTRLLASPSMHLL